MNEKLASARKALENLSDPGYHRSLNIAFSGGLTGLALYRYAREPGLWRALTLVRAGLLLAEAAWRPSSTAE